MVRLWDEVISEMLLEIDKDFSEYQKLSKKFNLGVDSEAKRAYDLKVSLCEELRKRILLKEKVESRIDKRID